MRIARGRNLDVPSENRTETFTGRVWADPVLPPADALGVTTVFFEPAARTHWHSHDAGQVLLVTHGRGWLQSRGGSGGVLEPGDVAHIPGGEEHWHGAGPETYLVHMAVSLGGHEWLEPVSDDEYADAVRSIWLDRRTV